MFRRYTSVFLLTLIIAVGAFFRFYNLNWGAPFYFHPDERNIASSVTQLHFPNQMNPHFFAYGSLPIYTIYFLGVISNLRSLIINQSVFSVSFEQAIVISRYLSTFFSTLLIPLGFYITKKIKNQHAGLFAAFLTAISVGLIQFSHFGTFEIWLSFFGLLFFYQILKFHKKKTWKNTIYCGLLFGILMATKISSLPLFILPFFCFFPKEKIKKNIIASCRELFFYGPLMLLVSFFTFTVFSPYVFLDTLSFLGSIQYESSVAFGTLPVFYTGEFFGKVPIIFQIIHIYPFLLNPFLTILFLPCLFYVLFISIKKQNFPYFMLCITYFILFFSQVFFFAKWTRYIVPTLPLLYTIIAITLADFVYLLKRNAIIKNVPHGVYYFSCTISIICFVFTISYFFTALVQPDTRVSAASWAKNNIPRESPILSEVYDLGITPFNPYFSHITLFNFYDLDNTPGKEDELKLQLYSYEYIILPSQRIIKTRLQDRKNFSNGNAFYKQLLNGQLGFIKIYETPCDIFCKITYIGNPVFSLEETANVFDRPTLLIFKNEKRQ